MFGISWAEFFVILLVAVLVIPARMWPDVARVVAQLINFIRRMIWKITDASENLKQQIDLEKPIDDLITNATNDMFGEKIKKNKKKNVVKKVRKK